MRTKSDIPNQKVKLLEEIGKNNFKPNPYGGLLKSFPSLPLNLISEEMRDQSRQPRYVNALGADRSLEELTDTENED